MIESQVKMFEVILELVEENPEICARNILVKQKDVLSKSKWIKQPTIWVNLKRLEERGFLEKDGVTKKSKAVKYKVTDLGKFEYFAKIAGGKVPERHMPDIAKHIKSNINTRYMLILKAVKRSQPTSLKTIANLVDQEVNQITDYLDKLRRLKFVLRENKEGFYTYTLNKSLLIANDIYPE